MGTSEYEPTEQTIVYLGNRNAIEVITADDGTTSRRPVGIPKTATKIIIPGDVSLIDAARDLTHATSGTWQAHSDDPAPAWVASTDPALAQLLAAHWGGIEVREPDHDAWAAGPTMPVDDTAEEG